MPALALGLAFLTGAGGQAAAQVIAESRGGASSSTSGIPVGQSVQFVSGGPYCDFTFNFYRLPGQGGAAFANGDLYLLSGAYTDTPAALSSSTPGYLASSTASGNLWTFHLASGLQSNTPYYFYMSSNPGSALALNSGNPYPDGTRSFAFNPSNAYSASPASDMDFTLAQAAAPVPGPVPGAGLLSWLTAALAVGGLKVVSTLRRRQPAIDRQMTN